MEYRHVGRSGLQVSVLSFGSWVTFGPKLQGDEAQELLQAAHEAGVNFFDTAENYSAGESERLLGQSIAQLGWPRYSFVISTKFFWGIHEDVNTKNTLNRKYLLPAMDASLERLGLDYVDVVFCHRHDPNTPMEEIVWAMSDLIERGKALYWGTSMWGAREIDAAFEVAERHHLRAPIVEQSRYNLVERERIDNDLRPIFSRHGLGVTSYAPFSSGVLTGKYQGGIPEDSRAARDGFDWLADRMLNPVVNAKIPALKAIADSLGCSLSQLALAWCASNPRISTVIFGASRLGQLQENLGALEVMASLSDEVKRRLDEAVA